MKKILLSIFAFATLVVTAQNNVSTTPENRNVVLEEFTGIYCGYCPDGHLLAQQLHDNNPGDVVLMNIHVGSYAAPQAGAPDFRTSFGTAIDGQADVAGYPAGTINRHLFAGMQQANGTAMSRGDWANAASQILPQSSPVNIWSEAIVDLGTNTVTVNVEVYYTGSQTITTNKLNVAVLQNNVEGPQSGLSANPGSILPNGNYNHNHMLRHLMTGQWGDELDIITQGTTITRTYTWTIPTNLNGVELDLANFEVIAFVSEGQQEIISGDYSNMSWNFPNTTDAYCMSSSANDAICAESTDLEVTFRNYGSIPLTSLDINYTINGGTTNTYPWIGNLSSAGTETINIPSVAFTPQATNSLIVSTSNPNGATDQNTLNDQSTNTFDQYLSSGNITNGIISGTANIDIVTDQYGGETTWELTDDAGNIVASGGPYSNLSASGTTVQPTVTANLNLNECYSFLIEDSYGDGINTAQYGAGSFTVTDAAGNAFITGGVFTSEIRENFNADGTATGISDNNNSELTIYPNPIENGKINIKGTYTSVNIYDVFGKLVLTTESQKSIDVSSLSKGVYFTNIKNKNAITVKKITIAN